MTQHTVVVVGSNATFPPYTGNFWVIDYSNPATPTAVSVSCPSTGVVLDCAGSLAAVASSAGDSDLRHLQSGVAEGDRDGDALFQRRHRRDLVLWRIRAGR